ncbi:eukaryotic translation initiation factor 2D [Venturia canescens]|uniref:eukaryotic translation initiation factor 2D n=1 Tax=Venturia canescens TaxID=32260 RepID=UPI001C9C7533|nr:eukaryotic translation initiation factor 2D [Venturia canescens]
MFIKPFKVKSNNQLKGTERKKLCEEILAAFPCLSDDQVQNLFPKKEAISSMKIITHNGQRGKLYCVAKTPMFFELEQVSTEYFPTIFTLWQHPNLLSNFTTVEPVVPKLSGGAHLMLPGVVIDGPRTLWSYGKLPKGTRVYIDTEENKAAVAVGVTALSSEDMYMSAGHGKCVDVIHVIGDQLCQLGTHLTRPDLGPSRVATNSVNLESSEENSQCTETIVENIEKNDPEEENEGEKTEVSLEIESSNGAAEEPSQPQQETDPVKEMDSLLEYCFLKACKSIKKTDLPMLSSTFFKNHLIAACPEGQSVDIKKSSYKKLSTFLSSMKSKGVINTEITKHVESILAIKSEHSLLRDLVVLEETPVVQPAASNVPVVLECYKVTADVLPILSKFGYEKGDIMKRLEIRKCFTDYVKKENLQDGKILKLDPTIAGILRTKENQITLTMEDGINKFIGRMTHVHEITFAGTRILHTGKLDPIDITVTTRASNKKVTLINNLEAFGIKLEAFSKECQGIGASATIIDVPGKKTPSVLVQGNQVIYVYKLLTEKYKINKNYIKGLEFAPKKRK